MGRSCSRVIVRWQLAALLIWFERPGNARIFGPSQRSCQSMCGNSLASGFRFQRMADHAWKRQGGMSVALTPHLPCPVRSFVPGFVCPPRHYRAGRTKKSPAKPDGFTGRKDCCHFLVCEIGAEDETRTRTACGHYPLKIACLPVPPLRLFSCLTASAYPPLSVFLLSAGEQEPLF